MEIAESRAYSFVMKRVTKLIWEYLDALKFDCSGISISFEPDLENGTLEVRLTDEDDRLYPYKLDPFAKDFSCDYSAQIITKQFIEKYNQMQALNNTIQAEMERLKKENAKIRDTVDAAYYAYVMKNYLNNKEDNKMAKFTIGDCEGFCTTAPTPKTAEQVEYEHKLLTLQRTLEDEVKAAKDKYAMAVDALNKERENAKRIADEDKAARNRKDRYDALVRAGFTEEQAWKMLMQDLGA